MTSPVDGEGLTVVEEENKTRGAVGGFTTRRERKEKEKSDGLANAPHRTACWLI
ncbi:MAG: hypothetical protein Q8835_02630 [Sweet potato little leaf phytoplasma]|nr:hypothetical protein [Sweet potato little leaf phytoplasma]